MLTDYQIKVINNIPKERKEFMEKQRNAFEGWMKGSFFMPCDGYCFHCKGDVIKYEMENGNDGSKGVTGCHYCHRSYCD